MRGASKELVRAMRKHLAEENRNYTYDFVDFPKEKWPAEHPGNSSAKNPRIRVARNKNFLVQIFRKDDKFTVISVNRTRIQSDGNWEANITWDQLQEIKSKLGFGDQHAVEVYPPDKDVVNVSNMRHLFLVPPELVPFAWKK